MIDDLVKRLRAYEGKGFETTACYNGTRSEAADRIEEYEQALANMQREYDKRGKCIAELEAGNQRLRLEVAHANDTTDAAIERIEELEAELAGAINVAYGVSEAAGKRRGELEAKLAVVEKERDDLRYLAKAETREDAEAFRNNAMNQIDRTWDIDRIKDAMGIIRTEGAISKIKGEQP